MRNCIAACAADGQHRPKWAQTFRYLHITLVPSGSSPERIDCLLVGPQQRRSNFHEVCDRCASACFRRGRSPWLRPAPAQEPPELRVRPTPRRPDRPLEHHHPKEQQLTARACRAACLRHLRTGRLLRRQADRIRRRRGLRRALTTSRRRPVEDLIGPEPCAAAREGAGETSGRPAFEPSWGRHLRIGGRQYTHR